MMPSRSLLTLLLLPVLACAGDAPRADAGDPETCDIDYVALKAVEIDEITAGEDVLRRLVSGEIAEEALSPADTAALERMEEILSDEARPVDDADLRILELAAATLADSSVWDREDDRVCAEADTTYSLFCALQLASVEMLGAYEHRRTVMQEVRFAIERARPGVEYEHRLMDFNNAPTTTLGDARGVLTDAADRVRERLARQARCEL